MTPDGMTHTAAELMTTGQAARVLGVSVETVRRYLDTGALDGCRLPSGQRRITRDSVEKARGTA